MLRDPHIIGAKQPVPHREDRREIRIVLEPSARMVNPVHGRRHNRETESWLELARQSHVGMREQAGALPLLQYALKELFERKLGRMMTLDAYRALGGGKGALGTLAEGMYGKLEPVQQDALRRVLLRLIVVGDDAVDSGGCGVRVAGSIQQRPASQLAKPHGTRFKTLTNHEPIDLNPKQSLVRQSGVPRGFIPFPYYRPRR